MRQLSRDSKKCTRARLRRAVTILELCIVLAILLIVGAILFPVFAQPNHVPHRLSTLRNLKQIALGNMMYATDYDEHLPIAERWMDDLFPYIKNEQILFDSLIEDRKEGEYGLAFFESISGVDVRTVVDLESVPLVFQSRLLHRNAASDLSTLPDPPRNKNVNYVAFLDSHAKARPLCWPEAPIALVIEWSLREDQDD